MNSDIIKKNKIEAYRLDSGDYTQSLINEALRIGLISSAESEKIQTKFVLALSKLIEDYTRGESSSVRAEKAQMLLKSLVYNIDIYLKSFKDADKAFDVLCSSDLYSIYLKGIEMVKENLECAQQLLNLVQENRVQADMVAYNLTIDKDIPDFFEFYDIRYGAHETTASFDYPAAIEDISASGIEYIYQYLKCLFIENTFCSCFNSDEIQKLLNGYSVIYKYNYKEMLVNIFKIVLTNAIGCCLLNKPQPALDITAMDAEKLKDYILSIPLECFNNRVKDNFEKMLIQLDITDTELIDYLNANIWEIANSLYSAALSDNLNIVLVIFRENPYRSSVYFEGGKKMDDEEFRLLINTLQECKSGESKAEIILEKVKNLEDFLDVLSSGCIFTGEFTAVFKSVSDIELAVILKYIMDTSGETETEKIKIFDIIHLSEYEKQWQYELMDYINRIDKKKKSVIVELVDKL